MTKTLVIHAGIYKTGSSAIQLYLARAEAAHDLGHATYPVLGRGLGYQHNNLNAELRGAPGFTPRLGSWDDLAAMINAGTSTTTVVSSENFSTFTAEQLTRLGDKFRAAGIRIRWVHYLRDQASFYNAFYVERLVNMRPEFEDVINLPFEDFGSWSPIPLDLLNYADFVEMLRTAIPDVDLVLRPFSRAHLVDGDAVADFCAATGVPYEARHAVTTNVGTGWRTVETARRLTPLVGSARLPAKLRRVENPAAARMRWIALIRSELSKASTEVGWNTESAIYMTPEFRAVLEERYRDQNERVGRIAGFDWPAIVAAEPIKAYNIGDYSTIPGDQVMTVVERVMAATLAKPQEIQDLPLREEQPHPGLTRRAVRRVLRRSGD